MQPTGTAQGGGTPWLPRTTTIRQDAQQAAELDAVARVDGVSTSEAVRAAIAEHIDKRRRDPAFQARLRRILEEERVVLERLAQ